MIMPKANFTLSNGTIVTIDGSIEEIQNLLDLYSGENRKNETDQTRIDNNQRMEPQKKLPVGKEKFKDDFPQIINLIKTCNEAVSVEKFILNQANEANRVLLPLYIVYEYFNHSFGLTTTEISKITFELGVKVSRQNCLRALKFSAAKFVVKDGNPPRYTLNRRGHAHIRSVLTGLENSTPENNSPTVVLTPKKGKRSSKTTTHRKGPKILITDLKETGFFQEKKALLDVKKKLEEMGFIYSQPALSPALLSLVRENKIKRTKENDIWLYSNL
jgi:hypothetical protein